jgi:hypothetical protein
MHQNRPGSRDIERIDASRHFDIHSAITGCECFRKRATIFIPEHEAPPFGDFAELLQGAREWPAMGSENLKPSFAQVSYRISRRTMLGEGQMKNMANGHSHRFAKIRISTAVAQHSTAQTKAASIANGCANVGVVVHTIE